MSEKPEALRLADLLESDFIRSPTMLNAAAELRRLHQEHEEDQKVIAVWRGRTQRAEAQRDALLEALKRLMGGTTTMEDAMEAAKQARAAIAKAEEGKT